VLVTAGLEGCANMPTREIANPSPRLRTDRWANNVALEPQGLLFAPNGGQLSGGQTAALSRLAQDWKDGGSGSVVIEIPVTGGSIASETSAGVAGVLRDMGLGPDDIRQVGYDPRATENAGIELATGGRAPVRVSFLRYVASVGRCGQTWNNVAVNFENRPYYNFGCAVNANIALMAADPRDLAGARPMAAPDAARRQTVLDKYRAGDLTSSAKDDQADGKISDAK
jgi:pilus assembly protein CpaD